jgi:hypothetical protein
MKTKTQKQKTQQHQHHKKHKKNTSHKVIHVKMKPCHRTNEKHLKPDPVLLALYSDNLKPKIQTKSEIVQVFLETLTSIRLYHWKTKSYSQHKATDQLYEELEEKVDEFVEVMQGKMMHPNRVQWMNDQIKADSPETKKGMVNQLLEFNRKMQNLDGIFSPQKDSDILSIRDDIVALVNRFLYLFSFDEI